MISLLIQMIEDEEQRLAVEQICDLYYKKMMKVAMGVLHHEQDAEDAVQEAFYCISKHADLFLDVRADKTVARVSLYTRNAAINIYNHKKRTNELFTSLEAPGCEAEAASDEMSVDELLANRDTAEAIRSAVNQLESEYRDVILLKYFFHYRNIDIAKVMHTDANDINGKIFRAKKKLREILKGKL